MKTILLGEHGNRMDIESAENQIAHLQGQSRSAKRALQEKEEQLDQLTAEMGRQKLAIQALTRFLVAKNMIDQDELNAFVTEVDAEDGVVDGMMAIDKKDGRLRFTQKKVELDGRFRKVEWT